MVCPRSGVITKNHRLHHPSGESSAPFSIRCGEPARHRGRLAPQRREDDTVVVRYRFFHGEQQVGSEQRDEFVLRVFGWHDRTVASLAFVQQDGEDTWEPTGALSWILSRRSWPAAGDDGLAGSSGFTLFSGGGLTMMPLDFAEEQSAELGIALTLSFFDNRLLIGYGQDLQASTRNRYPFVSIRLLDTTRFLGTKIGGSK